VPRLSTAEPIWQQLAARRRTFQTLQGLAEARLSSTSQNVTVESMVVVLQGFEAMRLEGISALGQPVFLLVSDGQRFSFYAPQEARLVSGTASAQNLQRVFGVALAPSALHYLLLGDIPLAALPTAGKLAYHPGGNLYVWEGWDTGHMGYYRIWFDAMSLHPVRFAVEDVLGRVVLHVEYADFRRLDNFLVPYRITADQPLAEQRVVWHYSDVQLNGQVAPALFHMRVPAGTKHVELE
jgi:outer membrane lipoprotein-sorting protein